jgi:hypothetical protein
MDLVTVILFLVLYYIRPQEWYGVFSSIHWVQITMLAGLATLVVGEHKLKVRDLFRTPHDWAVFAFWLWIVVSAPNRWESFKENTNLYIFYIVVVQVLSSVPGRTVARTKIFLGWWTFLIVIVALLAIATEWGFDPLDSLAITNGSMKGRLVLNLSIFDNPNGLGHSVVPAIPMLYYYLIWKRPMLSRALGVALFAIPLYCIYLTVSKGSFLCAGITFFATLAIGRPLRVQIAMAVLAAMFGTGMIFALPRMNELSKSKTDPAIQGRVLAFKHGYQILQTKLTGVGKGHWGEDPFITDYKTLLLSAKPGQAYGKTRVVLMPIRHSKAPHSSYVCTGAETGKPGLFLYVAVLYCCLRTVITARTETTDEERIRRLLFVLVLSYVVSSWMVDFEYRPTFFMFTAAIAALHRHLLGLLGKREEKEQPAPEPLLEPSVPIWLQPPLLPQPALAGAPGAIRESLVFPVENEEPEKVAPALQTRGIAWNWQRLGWLDLLLITFAWWGVMRFWAYMMNHM